MARHPASALHTLFISIYGLGHQRGNGAFAASAARDRALVRYGSTRSACRTPFSRHLSSRVPAEDVSSLHAGRYV